MHFSLCLVTANKAQAIQVNANAANSYTSNTELSARAHTHVRTQRPESIQYELRSPFSHAHNWRWIAKLVHFTVYEHFARFHHRIPIFRNCFHEVMENHCQPASQRVCTRMGAHTACCLSIWPSKTIDSCLGMHRIFERSTQCEARAFEFLCKKESFTVLVAICEL